MNVSLPVAGSISTSTRLPPGYSWMNCPGVSVGCVIYVTSCVCICCSKFRFFSMPAKGCWKMSVFGWSLWLWLMRLALSRGGSGWWCAHGYSLYQVAEGSQSKFQITRRDRQRRGWSSRRDVQGSLWNWGRRLASGRVRSPSRRRKSFCGGCFRPVHIVDFFQFVLGLGPDAAGAEISFDLVVVAESFDVCDLVAG